MKYLRLLWVVMLFPILASHADRNLLRTEAVSEHKIKTGENLYIIAKKYNADVRSLIRHNKLKPPYVIRIGDSLKIPGSPYHLVKLGESLSNIARKYNVGLRSVVLLNKLKKPYIIKPGQKIYIPDAEEIVKVKAKAKVKIAYAPIAKNALPYAPIAKIAKKTLPEFAYAPIPARAEVKLDNFADNGAEFLPPTKGKIISRFGQQGHGIYNDGINIKGKRGQAIRSAKDGEVMYSDNRLQRLGNLVLIRHRGGFITAYAHNAENLVQRGDKVKRGQVIATIGTSGNVQEPQLHFQIRKGNKVLDPEKYISR